MAKSTKATSSTNVRIAKPKKKRPGVHSKKKNSSHKHGKNYDKPYVGQGK
jgi:hypothetical protein